MSDSRRTPSGPGWSRSYVVVSTNTDRRTLRPSSGGASILRRDAGRRRSRQSLSDGGPLSAQLKNNRIAAGRSRVGTSGGQAVSLASIDDDFWHVHVRDYRHAPDRDRPSHPCRQGTRDRGRDPASPPACPGRGTGPTRGRRAIAAPRLPSRAPAPRWTVVPVTREDTFCHRDDLIADRHRLDDLEP